ncbi:MAG TPA: flagellar hook protein FlgE [Acidobacteriaceae bacterium]|nr:flagellar hook protein FlgE [Acidobacteriaceae bacterium]
MSLSTALSGLNAAETALQTISNNLANMNTDGYKSQTSTFADLFYQTYGNSGSGNPIQTGLGVQVTGTSQDFSNGAVASTGVSSNMALNGAGFFVVQNSSGAQTYTRNGDFTTNASGQLTTLGGQLVMGYPVMNGVVSASSALQPINVGSGTSAPATPTANFSVTANLNAGTAANGTFQSPISVYDSLGNSHVLTINYTLTAPNTWSYNVTVPSSDLQGGTGSTTQIATGTLNFNNSGQLVSPASPIALSIGSLADGASNMNLNWQLTDASGNSLLTQTASASSNNATSQDGFASGVLSSYSVLSDGTVDGTFSNGQTRAIGQVAVASFANTEGLTLDGDNQYSATAASGAAVIGAAGTAGRGTIAGSSVEQSNVDMATQFSELIVYQRAYEANAKAITAFDQMEQATIQMKS